MSSVTAKPASSAIRTMADAEKVCEERLANMPAEFLKKCCVSVIMSPVRNRVTKRS